MDLGDAPESALAYPSSGVLGSFPTCVGMGPAAHIEHVGEYAHFAYQPAPPYSQQGWDAENDGNADLCPTFDPNTYDQDECFGDGDAGLMMPVPYTITGPLGGESVVPCSGSSGTALGETCGTAAWGTNLDIYVDNSVMIDTGAAYVNVLMDWNQDGRWAGSSACSSSAPEHVLVDLMVPTGYVGPLSDLMPPSFTIGPNSGYVWTRFSITEAPVSPGWDGSGVFDAGETEDYLLRVDAAAPTSTAISFTWSIGDSVGSDGVVQEDIETTSGNGLITASLYSGTTALAEEGDPLGSVEFEQIPEEDWPEPPEGKTIVAAFDFGPDGATFSPAMAVTLVYEPGQIGEWAAEQDLVFASYNSQTGEWEFLPVSVDEENNSLTAEVSHFTVFSILSPAEAAAAVPWAVIGPIIGVVVIVGVAYYLVRRRKSPGAQPA